MRTLEEQILFCIPMGLGAAFMLWVLWAFRMEEIREKRQKQRSIDNERHLVIHNAGSRLDAHRPAGQWQRSSGSQ
jgi:hypothetical protein